MTALTTLLGLATIPLILGFAWFVVRKAHQLSKAGAADHRAHQHWRTSLVQWNRSPRRLWGELYERVPELGHTAALAVLGQAGLDAVRDAVMVAYPAPDACPTGAPDVASVPPEETPKPTEVTPVFFKPGEPRTLSEYAGQAHVTDYLAALIAGLGPTQVLPTEHQLFCGPPGMGKTLLVRTYVNTVNERNAALGLPLVRMQEEFPADLGTLAALDAAVRLAMEAPTALFIDEIHDLTDRHALKLYMLMEDGRYKFEDEPYPVEVPDVVLLGATTDYGAMHGALKRRFNRHMLEPMPREQIVTVVSSRSFPIAPVAAEAVVARTYFSGAPWEALQLYGQARAFAKAAQRGQVELADVGRVFESQRIDELGLRWMDRRVIEVLLGQPRYRRGKGKDAEPEFVCYGASEADVCAMAQLDRGEYRESVKPRLMARGLLQVRATYGQALTEKGAAMYGWLRSEAPELVGASG